MSPRLTKNDRTITLSPSALEAYNKWGHEKSKKVSQAIIEFDNKEVFTEEQKQWIKAEITRILESKNYRSW